MNKSPIVTFGKYKGQPVEVLASDPKYVQWLLSQSDIKLRYPDIINVIINNFQAPSETPEHNALQVKFLDERYRLKFSTYVSNISEDNFEETALFITNAIDEYLNRIFNWPKILDGLSQQAREDIGFETLEKIREIRNKIYENAFLSLSTGSVSFEKDGLDVEFGVKIDVCDRNPALLEVLARCRNSSIHYSTYHNSYLIEIKPVVSDDFPAVFRQMKLSKAKILFLCKYTGIGATREEFIKYFKTQDIIVVFESDIDNFDFDYEGYRLYLE